MKTEKPARSRRRYVYPERAQEPPKLDPDHPNFDSILLRRAKLASRRERARQNRAGADSR